ncbi:MAG: hypothetical protein NVSMB1_06300 [Polyangiales bacterium]
MRRLLFTSSVILSFVNVSCSGAESSAPNAADTDTHATDDTTVNDVVADETPSNTDTTPPADAVAETLADASGAGEDALVYGPYPLGPYGNKIGDTVPNFKWRGYVDEADDVIATSKPFVTTTTLDDLRRKARKPYALIHVAEVS